MFEGQNAATVTQRSSYVDILHFHLLSEGESITVVRRSKENWTSRFCMNVRLLKTLLTLSIYINGKYKHYSTVVPLNQLPLSP
jgi:hypothetical protein